MSKSQKEHVTKFFYEITQNFFQNFKCSSNSKYKNLKRMSVDFKTDIKKIKKYLDENYNNCNWIWCRFKTCRGN